MSEVYTIKYSKKDGESKITVLEGDTELASFPEDHADFAGILNSISIFKEVEDGMDIAIAGTIEDFNTKYSLDLDVNGEPDGDSDDTSTESGEVEIVAGENESTEAASEETDETSSEENSEEESTETEETSESTESEEVSDDTETESGGMDSEHLDTDAKHLSDIESRVAEIEATLSGLSKVFGDVAEDAEAIDSVVDNMQAEDAAESDGSTDEAPTEFGLNTLDSDGFTDAVVPDFEGSGGDEASVVYSGTRVWTDPAEDTDPSDAIGDEKKKDEIEEEYDMYDSYEDWAEPKKGLRKFKM